MIRTIDYVLSVTQQYKQKKKNSMKSISTIHPAITENIYTYWKYDVELAPQGLIIGAHISQYASYSAMFCPLYSNISKEQHKSIFAIHPAITENAARETRAPYLDMLKPYCLDFSSVELAS